MTTAGTRTDSGDRGAGARDVGARDRALEAALLAEAGRKAGVLWVEVTGSPARLAWFTWHEGAAYVLHGGDEQQLPGLGEVTRARLTIASSETHGRLLAWDAPATTVRPGTPEWDAVLPALIRGRLNAAGGEAAPARWAATCVLTRLDGSEPAEVVEAPGRMPAGSGAAAPRPTTATTKVPIPTVFGPRRKR